MLTRYDEKRNKQLKELSQARPGQRMTTIQKVAFTLGGLGKPEILQEIKDVIVNNKTFTDQEKDFLSCADDCFREGLLKPIQ